jgi:DNA polymerase III subunit chi
MTGKVDFYVLEDSEPSGRLRLACRIAEKAYLAGQAVLIWHTDPVELAELDDLLWTFADRSFVPHETLLAPGATTESPVILSAGVVPERRHDVLINLADEVPPFLERVDRVADIVDGAETRRRAGRVRFRAYRDAGVEPETHKMATGFGPRAQGPE